ncbi:hypothetical protein C2I36_16295 [Rhodobacteraceae bacterium WD3A24]|nr:hypothetical protein C2I36_16295 [Rhodobacteraceae bacterium WD3A24]
MMRLPAPMRSDLDRLRFVFIVTYGRSGSTLLQSLLNSAPGVMLRGENGNALFHVFRAWKVLEDTAFRGRTSFQSDPDRPWFGAADVAPAKFRDAALRAFVSDVLAPPASARVSGFKEIRYGKDSMNDTEFSGYMEFLLEQFPMARIVFRKL